MEKKSYSIGEIIFQENSYQKWMYSICEGAVDIYAAFGTPEQKKLVTLTKDQLFGEIGMIGMMPRTATAVAASENLVLEQITYEDMESYLQAHPENIQQIMHNVSRRIRELTEDLSDVQRTVKEMLSQKEQAGSAGKRMMEKLRKTLADLNSKGKKPGFFAVKETESHRVSKNNPPIVKYYPGQVIFQAGDKAECLYEIYSGSVGIYSDYQTQSQKLLAELHTEAVFGEMGILDDMPRSATAVCLEESSLLLVKKEHFMMFFQKKPMKVLQILQQMCMQLRHLSKDYLDLSKTLEQMVVQEQMDEQFNWYQLEQLAMGETTSPCLSWKF